MPILVPSILETSREMFLDTYSREMKLPGVERIQIDFGDGQFVPNTMLPASDIGMLSPAIHFEAHLMCRSPQNFLDYLHCGFATVIVHYEAYETVSLLKQAVLRIAGLGLRPGVCLKPETPVDVAAGLYPTVTHFQLMSIHPGFQGTPFLPETYRRIAELRKLCPDAIIEIDGGVHETNILDVAAAGADLLVLGSAITKTENMTESWLKLRSLMGRQ